MAARVPRMASGLSRRRSQARRTTKHQGAGTYTKLCTGQKRPQPPASVSQVLLPCSVTLCSTWPHVRSRPDWLFTCASKDPAHQHKGVAYTLVPPAAGASHSVVVGAGHADMPRRLHWGWIGGQRTCWQRRMLVAEAQMTCS